jgi:hypothetical protein
VIDRGLFRSAKAHGQEKRGPWLAASGLAGGRRCPVLNPWTQSKIRSALESLERYIGASCEAAGSQNGNSVSKQVKRVPFVIAEALNSENPTGSLHSEMANGRLSAIRKSKKEIPEYIVQPSAQFCGSRLYVEGL